MIKRTPEFSPRIIRCMAWHAQYDAARNYAAATKLRLRQVWLEHDIKRINGFAEIAAQDAAYARELMGITDNDQAYA